MHAKDSGAEVIPFIKVWVMFPCSVLMTFLFTRLSNHLSRERVFYLMTSLFLAFFVFYIVALYPSRDWIQPGPSMDYLRNALPVGLGGMVVMMKNWTGTGFYVMSELWSSIILSVLFWGFANQITRLNEAKRFYGLFGIGANFSGFVSGQLGVMMAKGAYNPNLPFGTTAWEQSLILQVGAVTIAGILAMVIFRWYNRNVLTDDRYKPIENLADANGQKFKFSMRDNLATLFRSRYVLYIAVIMVSYNLVINLVEVLWKHQVKELYPDANAYNIYMNEVSSLIGVIATFTALFISGNSIRKCGWTFTAMLTPVILFVTSIGFFGFFFMKEYDFTTLWGAMSASPLAMVVFFGSAQNVLSRASKYSVFDSTKEMAFIPLSHEEKIKSKAAIDGVCSRLGKSSGALIHQSLLVFFGSLSASAPYVGVFLLTTIGIWGTVTYLLGRRFNALVSVKPRVMPAAATVNESMSAASEAMVLKEQQAV